jgi:fructose-1,6-bisphosphatase/inositol monophosphatase family enzyme
VPFDKEVSVARDAVAAAAEIALRLQPGIVAETKDDLSPVTQADRECERAVAAILAREFPDDGILGEEGAAVESRSGRRWIIDPIDGTRDFVRGNWLWANLLALEENGHVIVGVVNLPVLKTTCWATRGGGAFRDGRRMRLSAKQSVSDSVVCLNAWDKLAKQPFRGELMDWLARFWAVRGLGGAADAMMLCDGQAEVWIEPDAKPWDFAPLKIIALEAGASYFAFDGSDSIYAGSAVIATPALCAEAKAFLVRQ